MYYISLKYTFFKSIYFSPLYCEQFFINNCFDIFKCVQIFISANYIHFSYRSTLYLIYFIFQAHFFMAKDIFISNYDSGYHWRHYVNFFCCNRNRSTTVFQPAMLCKYHSCQYAVGIPSLDRKCFVKTVPYQQKLIGKASIFNTTNAVCYLLHFIKRIS